MKGRKCATKKTIINKKALTVMFGSLLIGGVAAILGIFREAKNVERPPGHVWEEYDGDVFV